MMEQSFDFTGYDFKKTKWYYLTRLFKSGWFSWMTRRKPLFIDKKHNLKLSLEDQIEGDGLMIPSKYK